MSEGEKRKSKKKSKHRKNDYDEDYVEQEVAKAMKQMDKAMKAAKIAEKEGRNAQREGAHAGYAYKVNMFGDPSDDTKSGMTGIYTAVTHPGTYIHIEAAENIQVGSNNKMYIHKDKKKGRKPSKRHSSSDSDGEVPAARQTGVVPVQDKHPSGQTGVVPVQDKHPSGMTEAERRIYEVLHSDREVTQRDITVCSEHVGNWRRFLRHLKLEDGLLEQLHQDYQAEGVRQIIYQGVLEWTRKAGRTATVGFLAHTLQRVGYADALDHLQP